ncbi:MAG: SH3 domain-containing protein [Anaerolineales bacterium]
MRQPIFFILLFLIACTSVPSTPVTPAILFPSITPTLSPYPTLAPTGEITLTPSPPIAETVTPLRGQTTTRLNVRRAPNSTAEVLGILEAGVEVQILAQDSTHSWFLILYPSAEGKGWISAAYVTGVSKESIPLWNEPLALVLQPLNVRSGPGTSFNSLGMLQAGDLVKALGKDEFGAWIQIEYAEGPQGIGWVNAAFLRLENADRLPILSAEGAVIGTGTPIASTPTATPTLRPAIADGDSRLAPAWTVDFSTLPPRLVILEDEVSAPQGDAEDWVRIQFTAALKLEVQLACEPRGQVRLERWNEQGMQEVIPLPCNGEGGFLSADAPFLLRILALGEGNALRSIRYRLQLRPIE